MPATANGTPAAQLDLLVSTDGLRDYCEKNREFANSIATAVHEAAGILRWSIRAMNEPDSKRIARMVTKPLDTAAGEFEAAARAFGLTWQRASNLLVPAPAPIARTGSRAPFSR